MMKDITNLKEIKCIAPHLKNLNTKNLKYPQRRQNSRLTATKPSPPGKQYQSQWAKISRLQQRPHTRGPQSSSNPLRTSHNVRFTTNRPGQKPFRRRGSRNQALGDCFYQSFDHVKGNGGQVAQIYGHFSQAQDELNSNTSSSGRPKSRSQQNHKKPKFGKRRRSNVHPFQKISEQKRKGLSSQSRNRKQRLSGHPKSMSSNSQTYSGQMLNIAQMGEAASSKRPFQMNPTPYDTYNSSVAYGSENSPQCLNITHIPMKQTVFSKFIRTRDPLDHSYSADLPGLENPLEASKQMCEQCLYVEMKGMREDLIHMVLTMFDKRKKQDILLLSEQEGVSPFDIVNDSYEEYILEDPAVQKYIHDSTDKVESGEIECSNENCPTKHHQAYLSQNSDRQVSSSRSGIIFSQIRSHPIPPEQITKVKNKTKTYFPSKMPAQFQIYESPPSNSNSILKQHEIHEGSGEIEEENKPKVRQQVNIKLTSHLSAASKSTNKTENQDDEENIKIGSADKSRIDEFKFN